MGAVPSRESISLFSYFRGSYEVGMIPLTSYYFGASDDARSSNKRGDANRSPYCQKLREELLAMRRDPVMLYTNARDLENVKQTVLQMDAAAAKDGSKGSDHASAGGETAKITKEAEMQRIASDYWDIMPRENFSEDDLDIFLALVDSVLFDTDEEMMRTNPGSGDTAAASRTFIPVPCALCLAYPEGKERDGAFQLDGRSINIIGYFGLMTMEMQNAFKIAKRLPKSGETWSAEPSQKGTAKLYLNTAILTSAGDRTLERVLVLAAVMLRQQYHTIGRRHLLTAKLNRLLADQQQQLGRDDVVLPSDMALGNSASLSCFVSSATGGADPLQYIAFLKSLLTLPPDCGSPFFDPLLAVPLPSIPASMYMPTQYVNAAAASDGSASPPQQQPSSQQQLLQQGLSDTSAMSDISPDLLPQSARGSLPNKYPGGYASSVMYSSEGDQVSVSSATPAQEQRPLLFPQDVSGTITVLNRETDDASTPSVPLSQAEEDAITHRFCRHLEQLYVVVETASNNYSALKSLTENFAFLHCQIVLDPSMSQVYLVDMPKLTNEKEEEKPSAERADGAAPAGPSIQKSCTLSPSSAVIIALDPIYVRQATMWASSFFHRPSRLPSGAWIKYKLKDECEQLRHVLQTKDTLIAHWRKHDAPCAAGYLGPRTSAVLDHVRALQLEIEEARALPPEYWDHCHLYVNKDSRKYTLHKSGFGSMLIGVRAFTASEVVLPQPIGGTNSAMGGSANRQRRSTGASNAAPNEATVNGGRPFPSHLNHNSGSRGSGNGNGGTKAALAAAGAALPPYSASHSYSPSSVSPPSMSALHVGNLPQTPPLVMYATAVPPFHGGMGLPPPPLQQQQQQSPPGTHGTPASLLHPTHVYYSSSSTASAPSPLSGYTIASSGSGVMNSSPPATFNPAPPFYSPTTAANATMPATQHGRGNRRDSTMQQQQQQQLWLPAASLGGAAVAAHGPQGLVYVTTPVAMGCSSHAAYAVAPASTLQPPPPASQSLHYMHLSPPSGSSSCLSAQPRGSGTTATATAYQAATAAPSNMAAAAMQPQHFYHHYSTFPPPPPPQSSPSSTAAAATALFTSDAPSGPQRYTGNGVIGSDASSEAAAMYRSNGGIGIASSPFVDFDPLLFSNSNFAEESDEDDDKRADEDNGSSGAAVGVGVGWGNGNTLHSAFGTRDGDGGWRRGTTAYTPSLGSPESLQCPHGCIGGGLPPNMMQSKRESAVEKGRGDEVKVAAVATSLHPLLAASEASMQYSHLMASQTGQEAVKAASVTLSNAGLCYTVVNGIPVVYNSNDSGSHLHSHHLAPPLSKAPATMPHGYVHPQTLPDTQGITSSPFFHC